jgi:hypothetical protein
MISTSQETEKSGLIAIFIPAIRANLVCIGGAGFPALSPCLQSGGSSRSCFNCRKLFSREDLPGPIDRNQESETTNEQFKSL